ncbi:hypothetical protein [Marinobacterium arenosum]|uniref:hypothetical protein n=1 Tax=Marinobacterium arenosum TaxID=2862496 RepID=UPI001C98151E|nr:hypothetical protein [Marinobacterium arenosum]MBY4678834.1 hypothetical protein [Marinobacterium arenosum]
MTSILQMVDEDPRVRWSSPHPAFSSGHDARSSECGLLTLFYGNLERASRYAWLNAGRTLIDKTYLSILWQTQGLPPTGIDNTRLAGNLDSFIRSELEQCWESLEMLAHEERHELAIELVEQAAVQVLGDSQQHQAAASYLLFYLCPQLPVFPLKVPLAGEAESANYSAHHRNCREQFARQLPHLAEAPPQACYGNDREQAIVNEALVRSDWWLRRMLCYRLQTG